MLPDAFEYLLPTRILYGAHIIDRLQDEIETFRGARALLVTDRVLMDLGIAERVTAALAKAQIRVVSVFSEVPSNSTIHCVEDCARQGRIADCDLLIGLGGGSVMDTVKVANLLMVKGGRLEDHMGAYLLGNTALHPMMLIPTTAGTGSEVTKVAVIADPDNNEKLPFAEHQFYPQVAVLDPSLTLSLPPQLTAITGMDALTHAIESYVSKDSQPLTDAIALHVIRLIKDNLLVACTQPDNLEARGAMLVASCLGGICISQSMVGMAHGIAHALGGVYGIPHGLANALALPLVMEHNIECCPDRYARIAEALGVHLPLPVDTAQSLLSLVKANGLAQLLGRLKPLDRLAEKAIARQGVRKITELNRKLARITGMPLNLKQAGVDNCFSNMALVIDKAMGDGAMLYNPKAVEARAVEQVLQRIFWQKLQPLPATAAELVPAESTRQTTAQQPAFFHHSSEIYDVLGGFYHSLLADPLLRRKLLDSGLSVQFVYEDPAAVITLDASGAEPKLYLGDQYQGTPDVTMTMKAEFAHQFWQGHENIVSALARRKVKSRGKVPKAVKLLPVLEPTYPMYRQYVAEYRSEPIRH